MKSSFFSLTLGALLAVTIYLFNDQTHEIRLGLSILTFVAVLWMTETFHISVTALLVPILAVLTGLMDVKQSLTNFAHPIIYLFMGGFALASALREQAIDQWIAERIWKTAKGNARTAIWLLFGVTAFISMWISNTATTAMMLPLAIGLLAPVKYEEKPQLYWFVLLGLAYSANIGGIGTLVGSPPNAIAAANTGISFAQWMFIGIPMVIISMPLMLFLLHWLFKPEMNFTVHTKANPEPFTLRQKLTLLVFVITVGGWLFSKPLSQLLGVTGSFDSLVALVAIVLVAVLKLSDWKGIQSNTNWGVLILFGGGLTLSSLLQSTGSSAYLGQGLIDLLDQAPVFLFLVVLTFFVVMLTEIASNTASSALLIPIFVSVAPSLGLPEPMIATMIAIAASCAFMLPVATPPNAIVFGSGLLPQQQMMRTGLMLNLIMTGLLSVLVYSLMR